MRSIRKYIFPLYIVLGTGLILIVEPMHTLGVVVLVGFALLCIYASVDQ